MPPKGPDLNEIPATAVLALQDWLKLLALRGVEMRVAMSLAAKIYNSHNTKERLASLDAKKLTSIVQDKEQRKSVLQAVKGIASGETRSKKRGRDSDLLVPLPNGVDDAIPASLEIKEVLDPEALIPITLTVNRAPVKTAWAFIVAESMGFDRQEALSIAHVHVHISSLKHALMLGNILNPQETREAEEEVGELPDGAAWIKRGKGKEKERRGKYGKGKGEEEEKPVGSSQPWVGLMRSKPVIERPDGTWRAIEKGIPVQPSQAWLYITKAFKDYTPHVLGAMRLVAKSYESEELNRFGLGMYNEFKPEVEQWGQRGILQLAKILDQAKGPVEVDDGIELPPELEAEAGGNEGPPDDLDISYSNTGPITAENAGKKRPTIKPVRSGEVPLEEVEREEPDAGEAGSPPTFIPTTSTAATKRDDPDPDSPLSDIPPEKKPRTGEMTLEEYEAMLDAEADADGPGGFLEGGDIYDAARQNV